MHGNHHKAASSSDRASAEHSHSNMVLDSEHTEIATVAELDNEKQSAGQCCSGICLSAVLDDSIFVFVHLATSAKILIANTQTTSAELSGFIRPPQPLI
jgi:hypothetical protein